MLNFENFLYPIRSPHIARLQLIVPGRPHPKRRPRRSKRGVFFDPKENRQAEAQIKKLFLEKYDTPATAHLLPFYGPVRMTLLFAYEQPKTAMWNGRLMDSKPDLDNVSKTVMDALNGVLWHDDSMIIGMHAEKFYAKYSATLITADLYEPVLPTGKL